MSSVKWNEAKRIAVFTHIVSGIYGIELKCDRYEIQESINGLITGSLIFRRYTK